MKVITLISGGDIGGAKTHVLSLVAKLHEQIDVLLISLREGEFADDARAMGIPVAVVHHKNPLQDVKEIRGIVADGGFSLIHCHGAKANVLGVILKRKCGVPVVTTVHSDWRLDYMGNFKKKYT